ncbi:cofG [Symbiodinium sp. CCMP2592]|nr:cofG [Symbiodinium sp. CCMP2592]
MGRLSCQSVRGYLCSSTVHAKSEQIVHKIKASRGYLGPIARAQVKDLWGSDGDGGVTPSDRAAQRGVKGSKEMLLGLVEGLDLQKGQQVLVVDLMTNRFMSLASEDDESFASVETKRQHLMGLFLKEHWDDSFEAGPKQRPDAVGRTPTAPSLTILAMNDGVPKSLGCTCCQCKSSKLESQDAGTDCRLPEMLVESLGPAGHDLEKLIAKFRKDHAADLQHLQAQSSASPVERGSGSGSTTPTPTPARRTSCVPVYLDGEEIFDAAHLWLPEDPLERDRVGVEILARCASTVSTKLAVNITDEKIIWLVNSSDEELTVGPGELFGFNLRVFEEKPVGLLGAAKSSLPFLLSSDRQPLVHLRQDSGKGSPLPFRYSIPPKPKVNIFSPKALPTETNLMDGVRATQIGAVLMDHFTNLPNSLKYSLAWEAGA